MIQLEERAWILYCRDTKGGMDVRDSWEQLTKEVRQEYIAFALFDLREEKIHERKNTLYKKIHVLLNEELSDMDERDADEVRDRLQGDFRFWRC